MKSTDIDEKDCKNVNSLRVDFHSHTTCSDGHLTPQELMFRASNFQIEQFAITDHDTVAAIPIAKQYIKDENLKLRLISGIEFSTLWQNFEIHIVGLDFDENHPEILALIEKQQQGREVRAKLMAEKLAKAGFLNCYEDAHALSKGGSITRAHFARVLQNRGVISNMQKAFDKYIGKGKRAYIKPMWCSIEEASRAIQAAGGYSVIAHPMKYGLSTKWLRRLIVDFKAANGDAMEIVSAQMNEQQRLLLQGFCKEYQLFGSAGSDFHFPTRWTELGRNLSIPEHIPTIWQKWNRNL